ncbi:hypothetical protein N9043_00855 [bacterium]|nr:hypothetical protein [bacterium]
MSTIEVPHIDFLNILKGKVVKDFYTYVVDGELYIYSIEFTDGTDLDLGVQCNGIIFDGYDDTNQRIYPETI